MSEQKSLVVWLNGKYVPEKEATISIFDDGFTRGDAVFDAARTFHGKPFQLEEHLDRFFQSCEALQLKPALDKAGFLKVANDITEKNRDLIPQHGDYWIIFRVTRGGYHAPVTNIVLCEPIPFKERAKLYRDGIELVTPSVRRTPHWAFSPRIKTHNYLNFVAAEQEVKQVSPDAWPMLLDERGNLAEGGSSNIFLVRGKELATPRDQHVLPGVSRATVMKLARDLGFSVVETDLDMRDLYLADEVFLTSTSLCVCGVASVNGRAVKKGAFGKETLRLLDAYKEFSGVDVRAQYLSYL